MLMILYQKVYSFICYGIVFLYKYSFIDVNAYHRLGLKTVIYILIFQKPFPYIFLVAYYLFLFVIMNTSNVVQSNLTVSRFFCSEHVYSEALFVFCLSLSGKKPCKNCHSIT
ncbi:hypothetical protein Smp_031350 [Schistosoma mansoni]|uniref:hypothetical protein n=1 Tax=Schistosoma mansoni TaxID=6183 RepID=UPI0001A644BF|nr:hypothetical protein Smp_031350 [Schistosoma mansoni]|eukprot:XP_018653932.1 hypothetical protein Smp_031350 [Schistosoma mansoni]